MVVYLSQSPTIGGPPESYARWISNREKIQTVESLLRRATTFPNANAVQARIIQCKPSTGLIHVRNPERERRTPSQKQASESKVKQQPRRLCLDRSWFAGGLLSRCLEMWETVVVSDEHPLERPRRHQEVGCCLQCQSEDQEFVCRAMSVISTLEPDKPSSLTYCHVTSSPQRDDLDQIFSALLLDIPIPILNVLL